MRLINVQTMKIEYHMSPSPRYAILSHTWGEEEVMLTDYERSGSSIKSMKGYSKIKYTISQARKDQLPYAWIDTCCIDKTSSAELSEAINSMFKWYQKSEVCYAYLEDVHSIADESESFKTSRWFTRGWTLQELLAPKHIEFYGHGWTHLGSKMTLCHSISTITTIPLVVLSRKGRSMLHYFSVAIRLSWAGLRETTRDEDLAYCLLGLFDVNMPLLYGEGSHKAFFRLQEEILKKVDDETLLACDSGWYRESPLEPSPHSFINSSALVVARFNAGIFGEGRSRSTPITVTNMDLRIEAPLIKWKFNRDSINKWSGEGEEECKAIILQCCRVDEPDTYLVLPIEKKPEQQRWNVLRTFGEPLPAVARETLAGAEWQTVLVTIGSPDKSDLDIEGLWVRMKPSILASGFELSPLLNLSFTECTSTTKQNKGITYICGAPQLLRYQTKITFEFVGTCPTHDIAFIVIAEQDIMTEELSVQLVPKTCRVSTEDWISEYQRNGKLRDLYGTDSKMSYNSLDQYVCFWLQSKQCILAIFASKENRNEIDFYLEARLVRPTSQHYTFLKKKIGLPSFQSTEFISEGRLQGTGTEDPGPVLDM